MCGRFWISQLEDSPDWIRIINRLNQNPDHPPVKTDGEVFPGDHAAVIAMSRKGIPGVFAMQWGLPMEHHCLINIRSETADQKVLFRESAQYRRCLVPATGYFEWTNPEKQRYGIVDRETNPIYLGGLYFLVSERPVFAVLTREALGESARIHHRMPVLLERKHIRSWLTPGGSLAEQIPSFSEEKLVISER